MLHVARSRAAASAVALIALAGLVGTTAFVAARDDDPPPTTTSTSTTTTTVPASAVAEAIAEELLRGAAVALSAPEAACVAAEVVDIVGTERLDGLVGAPAPLTALADEEHDLLVRAVVACVPPHVAAALLGSSTTVPPPLSLPDEGTEG